MSTKALRRIAVAAAIVLVACIAAVAVWFMTLRAVEIPDDGPAIPVEPAILEHPPAPPTYVG